MFAFDLPFLLLCMSSGLISIFLVILILNLLTFSRLRPIHMKKEEQQSAPFFSILVPARNEEKNIAACVRSLVAQRYERLEVLVLDDNSDDATAEIVVHIIEALPPDQKGRLRLFRGAELPAGWAGKNFACHQLSQVAQGDFLFFTDADTIHDPDTIASVLACMKQHTVQMLTAQPEYILSSFGERLIMPSLNFLNLSSLPIALLNRSKEPILATGNGQLLCFERSAYEAIGGHTAVKGTLLEDVELAREARAAGYRLLFVDAFLLVRCRMYRSLAEVWRGYSRNYFAFYCHSLMFALFGLLLNLLLYVLPPAFLLYSLFVPQSLSLIVLAALSSALPVMMRIMLSLRFEHRARGMMLLLCLLHPISILFDCLILVNSIRWYYRRKGVEWKGRQYKEQK
ncbi:glycosyltransferase [Ktedonosporobacter rubrisoli]|uniref:4,4'-diaponeurosporenoate glycosyltransferase n=1 Tax=Ktedonosporobacter rubrisoli TaxID=2509675 RepID=A0A4P6JJ96_KTERU|nr:glycosyltransferase [Ktedonosporobacter rubrisoli]QBD75103.1 glycosyltransferase [Ktedonosporobacter rubrisoli]